MATLGTLSEYARHRGVAPAYVTQLKAAGRLVLDTSIPGRQRVNFEASDARISATETMSHAANGQNAPRGAGSVGRPPKATDPAADRIAGVYRQSQAQHKAYLAKLAELEYQKAAGRLVELSQVEPAVFNAFRALRDRVMATPRRVAPTVEPITDLREIEAVFAEELRRAFAEFERTFSEQLAARTAPPA